MHERSVESDFLLIHLKHLLRSRTNLRVVLMSATLDAAKISSYFNGCPVINIPGKSFPVEVTLKVLLLYLSSIRRVCCVLQFRNHTTRSVVVCKKNLFTTVISDGAQRLNDFDCLVIRTKDKSTEPFYHCCWLRLVRASLGCVLQDVSFMRRSWFVLN